MYYLPNCPKCGQRMESQIISYRCPNCHLKLSSVSAFHTSFVYRWRKIGKVVPKGWEHDGMRFAFETGPDEFKEWEEWYLPPASVPKNALILDVGARDGDTALFYAQHGYTNMRLVEANPIHFDGLGKNAALLASRFGARFDIVCRPFQKEDLEGVAFAKFDCEGCEYDINLEGLTIPYVAEMHSKKGKGLNPYTTAIGFKRRER